MATLIKIKRTTLANLVAAAAAGHVNEGEPYLITDRQQMAIGLTANEYALLPVKEADIAEVKMTASATAPDGWLFCQGQTVLIADYPLLFASVGVVYGGDGVTTFGIPDLRDRAPVGASATKNLGATGGSSAVTLGVNHLPSHSHTMTLGRGTNGGILPAEGSYLTGTASGNPTAAAIYTATPINTVQSAPSSAVGAGEAIDITPAYVALNYIIYTGVA